MKESIGARLDRRKGIGPGFDFLRIALSFSILAYHSWVACGRDDDVSMGPAWILIYALLPMFFALSGFLITGSAMRLRLRDFLINRGIRILPALAVEIVLSAILLGPVFTIFPLSQYFADPKLALYFTNILGLIRYQLPGVFLDNPLPDQVNVSLWTVPYEIVCYIAMAGMIIFGLLRRPKIVACAAGTLLVLSLALDIAVGDQSGGLVNRYVVHGLFLGRGGVLLPAFLLGSLIFLYRYKIPYDRRIFMACLGVCLLATLVAGEDLLGGDHKVNNWAHPGVLALIFCPPLAYITAYVGVSDIAPVPLYSKGDYSYGVYLYGFPIQQSLSAIFPDISVASHLLASVVLSSLVAMGSWHFIEKPILRVRKRLTFMARKVEDQPVDSPAQPALVPASGAAK